MPVWRAGCIIRAALLGDITQAYRRSPALPNLRFSLLKSQFQHYREKLALVNGINRALAECTALPEVYDRLSKSVMTAFPQADALYIFQVDPHTKGIRFIHSAHSPHASKPLVRDVLPAILPSVNPNGLQSEVVRTSRPLLVNDLPRYAARLNTTFPEMAGNSSVQSLLLSPMIARKTVQGILELLSGAPSRFTEADASLLASIGDVAALAIQNQYLKDDLEQANRALAKTYESTIESWRRALELRDQVTEGHASRVADMTAFFSISRGEEGQRWGELIEYDATEKIFTAPSDKRTEDYVTGRFG